MAVATLVVATVIVSFLTWIFSQEKKRRHFDKLGGPSSLPILGNVHQLKRHPKDFSDQFYDMISRDYSHLPAWRLMIGTCPFVFVCSPEEAEKLLNSSKHLDKSTDYSLMHPWLGTGLLTRYMYNIKGKLLQHVVPLGRIKSWWSYTTSSSTGEKWKLRRKLLTPTFHFRILHDFVDVFNEQAKILVNKFACHADGKTKVNVFNDITLCVLDIICETAMGQSVKAQLHEDSDYVKAAKGASKYTFMRSRTPWFWPKILFDLLGPGKEYDQCLTVLHNFTEKVIRERKQQFSKHHRTNITMQQLLDKDDRKEVFADRKKPLAFLDMLLCASADGNQLSFLDIREEVDTFMFEGHETTTMSTSWTLYLIGSHPDIQEKVHEELDKILGDSTRDITMEDLKEMRYLECCIKEALRLFPSVPLFGRSLTEDAVIAGVTVPKGTTTLIVPWSMHMNKTLYPEPQKFDPDRFLPQNCVTRHPFAFIPFSAGSRNCIGQKFAILEEKVLLATIFRNFIVQSTQKQDELSPLFELTLKPANGIEVILTRRLSGS